MPRFTPRTIARNASVRAGPRRQLKWATDNINSSVVSASSLLSQLNSVLTASQEEESTLVRTIICLRLIPVTPIADSVDAMLVSAGIGVASEEGMLAAAVADPSVAAE